MKGEKRCVEYLNRVLRNKLTAINQYFLHARMFRNWGLDDLNERIYKKSIEEMKHADSIVQRVLFLEGLPNLQDLGKLLIGENTQEMLQNDLAQETDNRKLLLESIQHMESANDFVSREMLDSILEGDEEHIDWLETQLALIGKIGAERYLQSQM